MNTDFRCDGRAGLTDNHEGGKHRSQLPRQCQRDKCPKRSRRSEACKNVITLKPEHKPRKQSHNGYHGHAPHTLFVDCVYPTASQLTRRRRRGDRARREHGKVAKTGDRRYTVLADRLQQTHHLDVSIVEASDFCKRRAVNQSSRLVVSEGSSLCRSQAMQAKQKKSI